MRGLGTYFPLVTVHQDRVVSTVKENPKDGQHSACRSIDIGVFVRKNWDNMRRDAVIFHEFLVFRAPLFVDERAVTN